MAVKTVVVSMLQYIVNLTTPGEPVLRLYGNDITPSETTIYGDLTEVTSAGYLHMTLLGSMWTTTQSGGTTTAVYSEVTFNFATDAKVYGYFVTNTNSVSELMWLERFSGAPFQIPTGGGTISITTKITLS